MTRILTLTALLVLQTALMADETVPATSDERTKAPVETDPVRALTKIVGYADSDRNGVNDLFQDANGDGVNDVTREAYAHRFRFADENQDGLNDIFIDRDGDGVNDRGAGSEDADGDGICDNVIDHNGDGVNDITGAKYDGSSLNGFRYGIVDEERGVTHRRFVDEDGDGMHDRLGRGGGGAGRMDRFIDEDGDGVCDGRVIKGRDGEEPRRARHRRGRSSGGGKGKSQ